MVGERSGLDGGRQRDDHRTPATRHSLGPTAGDLDAGAVGEGYGHRARGAKRINARHCHIGDRAAGQSVGKRKPVTVTRGNRSLPRAKQRGTQAVEGRRAHQTRQTCAPNRNENSREPPVQSVSLSMHDRTTSDRLAADDDEDVGDGLGIRWCAGGNRVASAHRGSGGTVQRRIARVGEGHSEALPSAGSVNAADYYCRDLVASIGGIVGNCEASGDTVGITRGNNAGICTKRVSGDTAETGSHCQEAAKDDYGRERGDQISFHEEFLPWILKSSFGPVARMLSLDPRFARPGDWTSQAAGATMLQRWGSGLGRLVWPGASGRASIERGIDRAPANQERPAGGTAPRRVTAPNAGVADDATQATSRTAWIIAAVVAVLVALIAIVLAARGGGSGSSQAAVPQLVQLDQLSAETQLEASGLQAASPVRTEPSTLVVAGTVLAQDPAGGTLVSEGETVQLTVAVAPEPSVVPPLAGLTEDEARAALTQAGFVSVQTTPVADSAPGGTVLDQTPPADSIVSGATPVVLVVSTGPASRSVPRTEGSAVSEVRTRLETVGWNVELREVAHGTVAEGLVVRTDPAVETAVELGSLIVVFVSTGPASVPVPAVVGLTATDAASAIEAVGLTLETRSCETDDQAPGTVTEQDPAAAVGADPGTTVSVCVAVPAPTPTPEPTPTAVPPTNNPPPSAPAPQPTSPPECLPTDSSCR